MRRSPRVDTSGRLDTARMVGVTEMPKSRVKRMEIDLRPMLGRVAVAPRGHEAFAGLWPGDFGGNMDAQEVREGTTVYLPIFHDGACFYSATDTPARATAKSPAPGSRPAWTSSSGSTW